MLRPDRLAANSYRILGLPAGASQEAIDQAARRMRIWNDAQSIPPTLNDRAWLGPVLRSKQEIEQAVAQLNDPVSRAEQRLLWFHQPDKINPPAKSDDGSVAAMEPPDSLLRHDAAVLLIHQAAGADPGLLDTAAWRKAIIAADSLSRDDPYLQAIEAIERDGDFEKRARLDEIEAAGRSLPDAVVAVLLSHAMAGLDENEFEICGRASTILSPLDGGAPHLDLLLADVRGQLLDKLEDLIDRRSRLTVDEVGARIVCDRKHFARHTKKNREASRELAAEYNRSVHPALNLAGPLCGNDQSRVQRIHGSAARAMRQLGIAWVWSGAYAAADDTFAAAESLAAGTPFVTTIQQARDENAARARQQRMGKSTGGTRSSGRLGWAALVVISMIVRAITSFNSSSTPSSNTMPFSPIIPSARNAPAFTPLPDRSSSALGDREAEQQRLILQIREGDREAASKPFIPPLSLRDPPAGSSTDGGQHH